MLEVEFGINVWIQRLRLTQFGKWDKILLSFVVSSTFKFYETAARGNYNLLIIVLYCKIYFTNYVK
jgi:hypothetical protein